MTPMEDQTLQKMTFFCFVSPVLAALRDPFGATCFGTVTQKKIKKIALELQSVCAIHRSVGYFIQLHLIPSASANVEDQDSGECRPSSAIPLSIYPYLQKLPDFTLSRYGICVENLCISAGQCFLLNFNLQIVICTMLQWMGGSRRKVTTTRRSTQKRQKQYFEQRKRQQQNLQITGSESSSDVLGISGQYLKEGRSLDILNLLNLSTNAQECYSPCVEESADAEAKVLPAKILKNQPSVFTSMGNPVESPRIEEARVPPGCQMDASQKKVLVSAPDHQNSAPSGIPSTSTNSKAVTDQYVGLSVIDLLYDDGPKITVEEHPTFEDHLAFSLEGLGEVGAETPPHSPQQRNRISYSYSQMLRDERKKKWSKAINHELEELELEVDTMMQDINAAPISNFSNLPYKKGKRSLVTSQDYNHFNDQANKNGVSISQGFFYNSEIKDDDIWNVVKAPSSSFFDEKFENEREYDTLWKKKTFQRGNSSPGSLKSGVCKARYAFEDYLPKKRSLAAAFDGFDTIELPATYSKCPPENDYDFFVATGARCSRSGGNFHVQSLVPEDVRDNSSLLSEESCSSTAVRGEAIPHSPSRLSAGGTSEEHMYDFGSPGNKRRSNEGKCRSMPNSSKQKPSHSNSIIEEDICARSSWQFGERYPPDNVNSGDSTFGQNLEAKFAAPGSYNGDEDPFGIFTIPESHDKASPSSSGLKSGVRPVNSPPCCFTSEKFAFGESHVFSDVRSWSTGPKFCPKFQLKGNLKTVSSFHCETPSPDLQEDAAGRDEDVKLEMQQDCQGKSEIIEETFMGKNKCSSEKKTVGDSSTSNNHTQGSGVERDPNLLITESLETTKSLGHVEEISSMSMKKPDKNETKVDDTKNNCAAETPLKCNIANEVMKNWQPQERSMVARKNKKEQNDFSGQVTFESYVFQLLCVQKVLKGGSLASI
ncbi:uncharacterized protein LOC114760012 [Neltuma alba]|uniref:uncharacterized protein LOC114760012 n=1 Tax=Neltuma alba TaxID=207710 RepID=UPI0010A4150D|nr:uncharacterized protein LOC114760012 [Prosopis alba]